MTNVFSFNGGQPVGSDAEVDQPELTDITLKDNAWEAAAAGALEDKAIWGVLLYVTDQGELCRIAINTDRASFRGILEETLDDFKAERNS